MGIVNKNGIIQSQSNLHSYLVNNFTESGNTNGWTLGGLNFSNGVAILTGTAPTILSSSFVVNPNEIVVVEFDINMTSPSSSGDGLYFGIASNSNTIKYTFNHNTNKWDNGSDNANASWDTYLLRGWHNSTPIHVKSYVIGSNVDISSVPLPYCNSTLPTICAIKLKNYTSTNLRGAYNQNTSMVFQFSNPKVYKLDGFIENNKNAMAKDYLYFNNFYEL